jgi:hypothetical protein
MWSEGEKRRLGRMGAQPRVGLTPELPDVG